MSAIQRETQEIVAEHPSYRNAISHVRPRDVAEYIERLSSNSISFGELEYTIVASAGSVPTPPHGTHDKQLVVMVDRVAFEVQRRGDRHIGNVTATVIEPYRVEAVVATTVRQRQDSPDVGSRDGEVVEMARNAETLLEELEMVSSMDFDADIEAEAEAILEEMEEAE